jgi:hypothetical protein
MLLPCGCLVAWEVSAWLSVCGVPGSTPDMALLFFMEIE